MQEQLVTFETAKLAKDKGFTLDGDNKCYIPNGQLFPSSFAVSNYDAAIAREFTKFVYAPTQSLLQRWLREVHKLDIQIEPVWGNFNMTIREYCTWIPYTKEEDELDPEDEAPEYFSTYELALEKSLKDALNLIK